MAMQQNPMNALFILPKIVKQERLLRTTRNAIRRTLPLSALFRVLSAPQQSVHTGQGPDTAMLSDAHRSVRCHNPARSFRVLSEWLHSRGNQPEDYARLCKAVSNWKDEAVISRLAESRITRLLELRRSTEALTVVAERLTVDPRFRPASAADTLSLAQIAARGGAPRIAGVLLSDFGVRFAGDPRVPVSEALKRRLTQRPSAPRADSIQRRREGTA